MAVNTLQKVIKSLCLGENAEIDKLAEEFMKVYIDAYLDKAIEKFSEESNQYSNQLEAMREYLQIDDKEENRKIYYFAMIDTIKNISDRVAMLDAQRVENYSGYKYIYPILETLYNHGTISIGNLATSLNMERHSLTNAIKRADKFELWSQKKIGRNSLYQITVKGEQAYTAYKKNKVFNDQDSLDDFVSVLLGNIEEKMLELRPDINAIIRKLNRQMSCSGFSSSMLKINLQRIFNKRDEYMKENAKEYLMKYNALKRIYLRDEKSIETRFHQESKVKNYEDGYYLSSDHEWEDYSILVSEVEGIG